MHIYDGNIPSLIKSRRKMQNRITFTAITNPNQKVRSN